MRRCLFLPLLSYLLIFGCKEFYDDEIKEFEESHTQSVTDEARFSANLVSTDPRSGSLSGTATIDLSGEEATVMVNLKGVPGHIGQMTYRILSTPCSSLSLSIAQSNQDERVLEIREGLGRSSLLEDLRSAGTTTNDLVLNGKSFVIRGTPQFSGLPNPSGTNELSIACGALKDDSPNRNEASDIFLPRDAQEP